MQCGYLHLYRDSYLVFSLLFMPCCYALQAVAACEESCPDRVYLLNLLHAHAGMFNLLLWAMHTCQPFSQTLFKAFCGRHPSK